MPEARGTPECPGIGFGLDRDTGSICAGFIDRIAVGSHQQVLDALWEREMLTGIYVPRFVTARTGDSSVDALAFVVNRAHPQYAGGLSLAQQAQRVALATGELGSCLESVSMTLDALGAAGIEEPDLSVVLQRARSREASR